MISLTLVVFGSKITLETKVNFIIKVRVLNHLNENYFWNPQRDFIHLKFIDHDSWKFKSSENFGKYPTMRTDWNGSYTFGVELAFGVWTTSKDCYVSYRPSILKVFNSNFNNHVTLLCLSFLTSLHLKFFRGHFARYFWRLISSSLPSFRLLFLHPYRMVHTVWSIPRFMITSILLTDVR